MLKNYEKLFSYADKPHLPEDLFFKIMNRLHREEKIKIYKKLFIYSLGTGLSFAGLFFSFQESRSALYESGFFQFLSLLFSDFSIIQSYWKNFAVSLMEALPAMSLAVFLSAFLLFINLFKSLIINIKIAQRAKLIKI